MVLTFGGVAGGSVVGHPVIWVNTMFFLDQPGMDECCALFDPACNGADHDRYVGRKLATAFSLYGALVSGAGGSKTAKCLVRFGGVDCRWWISCSTGSADGACGGVDDF